MTKIEKMTVNEPSKQDESWQVVDVDSIADALETVSLGNAATPASSPTIAGSTIDGSDLPKIKTESPNKALLYETKPDYTPPTPSGAPRPSSKTCRSCNEPAIQYIVKPDNKNGNAGRPYSVCVNDECDKTMLSKNGRGWVGWDDKKGISEENPDCYCGTPSRQDLIGKDEGKKGQGFWTCAEGDCGYYSADRVGEPGWNGEDEERVFKPWLL